MPLLNRDGVLRLYHSHYDQWIEVTYEKEGVIQTAGVKRINSFMRSRRSGLKMDMDLNLIRLLDHLQDHFEADTVEVICGYRSPDFNRFLKREGRNVAEDSYHLRGMAADIHLDEISEKTLKDYVTGLHLGGVGYYPDLLMVHVDFGPPRFWQDGTFTNRRDIGIFTELPVIIKTDKLFYFPGEKVNWEISNPGKVPLKPELKLEQFFRGAWIVKSPQPPFSKGEKIDFPFPLWKRGIKGDFINAPIPYGKYRWKVEAMDGKYQYSNEFYLKKL